MNIEKHRFHNYFNSLFVQKQLIAQLARYCIKTNDDMYVHCSKMTKCMH